VTRKMAVCHPESPHQSHGLCPRCAMQKYYVENKEILRASRRRNPTSDMLFAAKRRARAKGLEFTITKSDIVIPEFCPILGIKLAVNGGGGRVADGSPSLDRIDASRGYVPGNIAVISYKANAIKSFGTVEEHRRIADWMESMKQPHPAGAL